MLTVPLKGNFLLLLPVLHFFLSMLFVGPGKEREEIKKRKMMKVWSFQFDRSVVDVLFLRKTTEGEKENNLFAQTDICCRIMD